MSDRLPDAQTRADLMSAQEWEPELKADEAAAELIGQLVAWNRVASWVESQRLATMRRFQVARTDADAELSAEADEALANRPPSERAAILRLRADLAHEAGKVAAEEIALSLNISPSMAHKQLRLANDLYGVHPQLGEALELGQVSPFVASMVAATTRRLPDHARRVLDELHS